MQGKLEEAKSAFERAIKIWEAALEGGHPKVAEALNDWGKILEAQVRGILTPPTNLFSNVGLSQGGRSQRMNVSACMCSLIVLLSTGRG